MMLALRPWTIALVTVFAALGALGGCARHNDIDSPAREQAPADGIVTLAEYRGAIEAEARCVQEAGYQTSSIKPKPDGIMLDFSISVPAGIDWEQFDEDAASSAKDSCYEQYARVVERQYFQQNIPTGTERDAMFDAMLQCLNDAGVTGLTRSDSEQDVVASIVAQLPDDLAAGFACMDRYTFVFPDGQYP